MFKDLGWEKLKNKIPKYMESYQNESDYRLIVNQLIFLNKHYSHLNIRHKNMYYYLHYILRWKFGLDINWRTGKTMKYWLYKELKQGGEL